MIKGTIVIASQYSSCRTKKNFITSAKTTTTNKIKEPKITKYLVIVA